MPGMTGARATGFASIGALVCCLVCCAIPGVVAIIVLNQTFGEWPVVDATVIATSFCSSSSGSANSGGGGGSTYSVTYNFTTLDGRPITATTGYCIDPVPDEGEIDQIAYDPDDPTTILDETILEYGLIAAKAAAGIGWACAAIALAFSIMMCSRKNQNNNANTMNTYQNNNNNSTVYGGNNGYSGQPSSAPNGQAADFASALDQPPPQQGNYYPSAQAEPYHTEADATPVSTYGGSNYGNPYGGSNLQSAQVYGGNNSGPVTSYKPP